MYPYELVDEVKSTVPEFYDTPSAVFEDYFRSSVPAFTSGTLKEPIVEYKDWPVENIQSTVPLFISGTLKAPIVGYSDWPAENIGSATPQFTPGTLEVIVIVYSNWSVLIADESVTSSVPSFSDGTLT